MYNSNIQSIMSAINPSLPMANMTPVQPQMTPLPPSMQPLRGQMTPVDVQNLPPVGGYVPPAPTAAETPTLDQSVANIDKRMSMEQINNMADSIRKAFASQQAIMPERVAPIPMSPPVQQIVNALGGQR